VPSVLLISGSTRAASSNSALIRTAAAVAPAGVSATVYDGLSRLPHFNPDDDREPLPLAVAELRAAIGASDGVLICTPEYAGTLPGSMKNLLDWCVGGTEINAKRVAWVNAAADPRRGGGATATLATVLGYVQAEVVDAACRSIPVPPGSVAADGLIHDETVRTQLTEVLRHLAAPAPAWLPDSGADTPIVGPCDSSGTSGLETTATT
jgi:NAD(P)H-dependent FMN reductase